MKITKFFLGVIWIIINGSIFIKLLEGSACLGGINWVAVGFNIFITILFLWIISKIFNHKGKMELVIVSILMAIYPLFFLIFLNLHLMCAHPANF